MMLHVNWQILEMFARKLGFNIGIKKDHNKRAKTIIGHVPSTTYSWRQYIEHGHREHTNNSLMNRKGDF